MRFKLLAAALAIGMITSGQAQHDDHVAHQHHSPHAADAHIVVTINPEARVRAAIGAALPAAPKCGAPMLVKIRVLNQGFVTAPLRAAVAGDGGQYVTTIADDTKLSGAPEDERVLQFISQKPTPVDVTIAFSIDDTIGDLAGRDRVHLLLRCQLTTE